MKLTRHGKDLIGLCPFHDDREPSLVVTPKKNLWHCLGACQTGGGPIDWVMRTESVSFRHAVELLRSDSFSLAAEASKPRKKKYRVSKEEKLDRLAEPEAADAVVLGRVVAHYQAQLEESPEALAYLKDRGLVHAEMIGHFHLGYANRTLSYRLPPKNRKAGATLRAQLERLGVMRGSGHEHLSGSIVVPIFDAHGQVVEMYGRKIRHDLRKGTPKHLYLPGPHRGVFNHRAVKASREVIVCESLIDALTFWCAGYRNVTTAYGTEGYTDELHDALVGTGTEQVLIAFDRDAAGDAAAAKVGEAPRRRWPEREPCALPEGDGRERVRAEGDAGEQEPRRALASGRVDWRGEARPVQVEAELVAPAAPEPEDKLAAALAAPEPASPTPSLAAESKAPRANVDVRDEEVVIEVGDRRWRIRGLGRNLSYEQLRVNVLVARNGQVGTEPTPAFTSTRSSSTRRGSARRT